MSEDGIRLDKWLWHARFAKTRSIARKMVESGQVAVNGRRLSKPSAQVRPGDDLTLVAGPYRRFLRVLAPGTRRGPAPEAQALYESTAEPERLRPIDQTVPARAQGAGRPTKKDRRALDRFFGGDD